MPDSPNNLDSWASAHGFSAFLDVSSRNSIADAIGIGEECGIYIIEFDDGQAYIGLSKSISDRFNSNRARWDDIKRISWMPAAADNLAPLKRQLIAKIEIDGFLIRNIKHSPVKLGETKLDSVVPHVEQDGWLQSSKIEVGLNRRPNDEKTRRKTRQAFEKFKGEGPKGDGLFQTILPVLKFYICSCIPFPELTEFKFWSITALNRSDKKTRRLCCRININWQEVLFIECNHTEIYIHNQVRGSIVDEVIRDGDHSIFLERGETAQSRYDPGGEDQIRIIHRSIHDFVHFLKHDKLRYSAKDLNLSLMRNGGNAFSGSHCFELVDHIVAVDLPTATV